MLQLEQVSDVVQVSYNQTTHFVGFGFIQAFGFASLRIVGQNSPLCCLPLFQWIVQSMRTPCATLSLIWNNDEILKRVQPLLDIFKDGLRKKVGKFPMKREEASRQTGQAEGVRWKVGGQQQHLRDLQGMTHLGNRKSCVTPRRQIHHFFELWNWICDNMAEVHEFNFNEVVTLLGRSQFHQPTCFKWGGEPV